MALELLLAAIFLTGGIDASVRFWRAPEFRLGGMAVVMLFAGGLWTAEAFKLLPQS